MLHRYPKRVALGMDQNRLSMLLAVLHRHGGLHCGDQDVFLNLVGGVRSLETSTDLASLAAIVSSLRGKALDRDMAVFGELGLSGEVRPVPSGPGRHGHGPRPFQCPPAYRDPRSAQSPEVGIRNVPL